MSVLIVIPMFGKSEYTDKCINRISEKFDILVVDDGSPKPYKNYKAQILRLDKNAGFTNAINQGILYAQKRNYDYVLLLNNDTEPEPLFLDLLLNQMIIDKAIGIASSVRLYKDKTVELFGADLIRGYQMLTKYEDLKKEIIPCLWVPFCSVLLRMDMIREIGLLDKEMITYDSDNDYCIRANMVGWKTVVVTESQVFHHHSVTSKGIKPDSDQAVLLAKLAGLKYAKIMSEMPLDSEHKTWGQIKFEVVQR